MRQKLILTMTTLLLSLASTTMADNKQIVTIGQRQVEKTVQQLTFNEGQVVLHYSDQTSETADMADVVIVFTVADALKALEKADRDAPLAYFDINGRQLKRAPAKGSYIIKKGKKIVKLIK